VSPSRALLGCIEHELLAIPQERAVSIEHAASEIRKIVVELGQQDGMTALCLAGARVDIALEEGGCL